MVVQSSQIACEVSSLELSEHKIGNRGTDSRNILQGFPSESLSSEQALHLDREGYLFLPSQISREDIESFNSVIDNLTPQNINSEAKNYYAMYNHGENFRRLMMDPLPFSVGSHIFDDPANVRLLTFTCREPIPSKEVQAQELHRDAGVMGEIERPSFVLFTYLDPSSESRGATTVIPGSHLFEESRLDEFRTPDRALHPEEVVLSAEIGDCLLIDAKIFHRGLGTEKLRRRALYIQYVHGKSWFADMKIPPEAVAKLAVTSDVGSTLSPRENELLKIIPRA